MTDQYQRSIDTEAQEVDSEWMVLHADQFTVTVLNELGGFCWGLLKEPQTLESLTDECLKVYSVSEEQAAADIRGFLSNLMEIGLIRHAS